MIPIVLLILHLSASTASIVYPCKTPDDEQSYCVSLFSCPHLMKSLGSLQSEAIDYVKQSICLGCNAGDFMVCCGTPDQEDAPVKDRFSQPSTSPPKVTTTESVPTDSDLVNRFNNAVEQRLLPDTRYCGFQHTDDRYHNRQTTAIDEFPWMVHVRLSHMEYENQFADRCNGVLISSRYVLTNAYCGLESIKVKLGEYNTNKTISCETANELEDCTDHVLDLPVEEIIRDGRSQNGPYDFVLLRLNQSVHFSDYIRPICLPIDPSQRPNLHSVVISGWGASDDSGTPKKRLVYNIVEDNICFKQEEWLEGNIKFANVSFICASPTNNQVGMACFSERGSPFMYDISKKHQWFAEGIIVHVVHKQNDGPVEYCSKDNTVNGIRITENTIDWILATIRP